MKLIKSSFEILEQEPGLSGIYKAIERAGRTCYKSEDKITEDSAPKFVDMLINRGHTAVLEQGTVYLTVLNHYDTLPELTMVKYIHNPYSKVEVEDIYTYITTNYRVLYENGWLDDLKYQCEPTEYHAKRICVKFITDRGVMAELTRHRSMSFCVESTRYCNYSLDKFGNELTFIIPSWLNLKEGDYRYVHESGPLGHDFYWTPELSYDDRTKGAEIFLDTLSTAEVYYMMLLGNNNHRQDVRYYAGHIETPITPQQARQILPNALKTEVVMTGFIEDWQHFFSLRCDNAAHPDMRALIIPLKEEFIKRGYLNG